MQFNSILHLQTHLGCATDSEKQYVYDITKLIYIWIREIMYLYLLMGKCFLIVWFEDVANFLVVLRSVCTP